mgnify:CR=1 FL=1
MRSRLKSDQIDQIIRRLQSNEPISTRVFQQFLEECYRIVSHLYRRVRLDTIVYDPALREEIIEDVTINALIKALRQYNPSKAGFFTFYYSKSRSLMGVKQGFYYRRQRLINTKKYVDRVMFEE